MTALFHRGMYRETMRRLRTPAVFMLVLSTVFDAFPLILRASHLSYMAYWVGTARFDRIHYSLYTIPFIVVPILMLVAFRYQHRRAASDLYFSLPLSKTALTVTQLCAVLTWTAIIILGSSLIMALLCLLPVNGQLPYFNLLDVLHPVANSLASSFFMSTVFTLAVSLCGTTVNTLLASALMLFAPRLVSYTLNTLVLSMTPVLSPQSTTVILDSVMGNLLYGGQDKPLVWVSTLLKAVLILALALWAASRRPTEMAGRATVHPALHIVFRTLVGTLLSLPAVSLLMTYNQFDFDASTEWITSSATFFYILALVGYYLYELITTRKAKNLIKATVWLPLLVAVNLAMIGGCLLTEHVITHTVCTPATVSRVELRAVALRMNTSSMMRDYGYIYTTDTWFDGLVVMSEYDKNSFYYRTRQYAESKAPNSALTSEESRTVVCDALERTLVFHNSPLGRYSADSASYLIDDNNKKDSYVYIIDVVMYDGWLARSRRIGVTAEELRILLDELNEQDVLPPYFTNILR